MHTLSRQQSSQCGIHIAHIYSREASSTAREVVQESERGGTQVRERCYTKERDMLHKRERKVVHKSEKRCYTRKRKVLHKREKGATQERERCYTRERKVLHKSKRGATQEGSRWYTRKRENARTLESANQRLPYSAVSPSTGLTTTASTDEQHLGERKQKYKNTTIKGTQCL